MSTWSQALEDLRRRSVPEPEAVRALEKVAAMGPRGSYDVPGRGVTVAMLGRGDWQVTETGEDA